MKKVALALLILANTLYSADSTIESLIHNMCKDLEETIQKRNNTLTKCMNLRNVLISEQAISPSKKTKYLNFITTTNEGIKTSLASYQNLYAVTGCKAYPDKFPSCRKFSDNLDTLERLVNKMLATNQRSLDTIEKISRTRK